MKIEVIVCKAKSCGCTYCATKDFNEAECNFYFHPKGTI